MFNKIHDQLFPIDIIKTIDITSDYIEVGESIIRNNLLKLEVNGKSLFDEFLQVSPKKVNKKNKIIEELDACLTLLIQGEKIPPNKLHSIGSNEYEIRIKRTRLYFFYDPPNNNIIVLGHYNKRKDDQQIYIDKFRILKAKYISNRNEQV
ncbi:hypothetical protein [Membranihabitans marinus]|uniref:hypothetical protein n=1 Tax=Membranihabitans marinus TaxID=1227546 RepID=UPI001F471DDE|nr:hypothetical protein [Membranihabitans marinus]